MGKPLVILTMTAAPFHQKGIQQPQPDTTDDGRISNIEDVPGPVSNMEMQKIHHSPIAEAVNHITDGPTNDPPTGETDEPTTGPYQNDQQPQHGQQGYHDEKPAAMPAKHPERHGMVPDHRETETGHHGYGSP